MHPRLCQSEHSQLVVIDMQTRLLDAMPDEDRQSLIENTRILLRAATLLEIPLLVTEQYPRGLGHTDTSLAADMPSNGVVEKTCFSCMASDAFKQRWQDRERSQAVICGVEAHVCVLQTAMELLENGQTVFVVEDAVCSRRPANKHNALQRIRQAGGIVTNMESVLFEWLRDAKHERFKDISSLIR